MTLRWPPRPTHLVLRMEYTVSSWGLPWTGWQGGVPGEAGLERAMEAYTMLSWGQEVRGSSAAECLPHPHHRLHPSAPSTPSLPPDLSLSCSPWGSPWGPYIALEKKECRTLKSSLVTGRTRMAGSSNSEARTLFTWEGQGEGGKDENTEGTLMEVWGLGRRRQSRVWKQEAGRFTFRFDVLVCLGVFNEFPA